MTGRPGRRTMDMNGGSFASYLARTPCVTLFCTLFYRGGNKMALRLPWVGGDRCRCTVEPSRGHIWCRVRRVRTVLSGLRGESPKIVSCTVGLFPLVRNSGTKIQPKEEVFGRISLRTSGQKLRSGPPNPGKNKHSRTDIPRGRP